MYAVASEPVVGSVGGSGGDVCLLPVLDRHDVLRADQLAMQCVELHRSDGAVG